MTKHQILLGIEHLMTGVQIRANGGADAGTGILEFERESASIVRVRSDSPIQAYWPVSQVLLESTEVEVKAEDRHNEGEVEWVARVVGPAMLDCEQRLYFMQTYTRETLFTGPDGKPTRYAPGEPVPFPKAVVDAMVRKHGVKADEYLAKLRWSRDHWFYTDHGMYIGVEPDGYIHT